MLGWDLMKEEDSNLIIIEAIADVMLVSDCQQSLKWNTPFCDAEKAPLLQYAT